VVKTQLNLLGLKILTWTIDHLLSTRCRVLD